MKTRSWCSRTGTGPMSRGDVVMQWGCTPEHRLSCLHFSSAGSSEPRMDTSGVRMESGDPFAWIHVASLTGSCNFSPFSVSLCGSETGATCILKNMHSGFDLHVGQLVE